MDALGQLIIHNGKFTKTLSSNRALQEWRLENNHLAGFVDERLYAAPQAKHSVQAAYDDYFAWSAKTGRRGVLGRKHFSKRL